MATRKPRLFEAAVTPFAVTPEDRKEFRLGGHPTFVRRCVWMGRARIYQTPLNPGVRYYAGGLTR